MYIKDIFIIDRWIGIYRYIDFHGFIEGLSEYNREQNTHNSFFDIKMSKMCDTLLFFILFYTLLFGKYIV